MVVLKRAFDLLNAVLVILGVAVGQSKDAANRLDRSSYDSAKTLWTAGLVGTIVGGAAVVTGGILFLATPREGSSSAKDSAFWIGVQPGGVRVGGTW